MRTLTMKFGGTSVGNAEAILQTTSIVRQYVPQWDRLVVVVSAMNGVTNALLRCADTAASGDGGAFRTIITELRTRHHQVVDAVLTPGPAESRPNPRLQPVLSAVDASMTKLASLCESVYTLGEATPRTLDAIASLGERINMQVVTAALAQQGVSCQAVDAGELIVTDDQYQNALPQIEATREQVQARLVSLLEAGVAPVVTGFIGATAEGVTTTLGRGGSDYTAAILGDCLDADEIWIWTDVDGVMTADPRIVPEASIIPVLSYGEVSELAYYGAKVLYPKSILPAVQRNIPLWVKNTFNPELAGTKIVSEPAGGNGRVKAVTAINGLSMVIVEGRGMMGKPGIAARTFAAVGEQRVNVLMISQASSEQSICFVVPTPSVPAVIQAVEQKLALELARGDVEQVGSRDEVVIVTAVSAGLHNTPGLAARIFGALGAADINVQAIAQGSSKCGISLVVAAEDAGQAVRQIHQHAILGG